MAVRKYKDLIKKETFDQLEALRSEDIFHFFGAVCYLFGQVGFDYAKKTLTEEYLAEQKEELTGRAEVSYHIMVYAKNIIDIAGDVTTLIAYIANVQDIRTL